MYTELKDNITSEDKTFLKWCPVLKDGITDLVKRRKEYTTYLNNKTINQYIYKKWMDEKNGGGSEDFFLP